MFYSTSKNWKDYSNNSDLNKKSNLKDLSYTTEKTKHFQNIDLQAEYFKLQERLN